MRAPCVARVWLDACAGIAPPPHERSRPYLPFTEATSEIDVLRGVFALRPAKLPSNVLPLSCKSRLKCLPREAARRLPRPTPQGQERTAAGVTRACSSKPPQGGFAAGPADRRLLSACEGS